MSQGETNNTQGEQDTAELWANTDANHICSNLKKNLFLVDIYIFKANEIIRFFCLKELPSFT